MKITENLGMILLSIWLILLSLTNLLNLKFTGLGIIMSLLALFAGILILIRYLRS